MLETHFPTLIAVLALAACWTLEALLPAVPAHGRRGAARLRHIALGLLNAVPAVALAGVLGVFDAMANASDFGVLRAIELPIWAHLIIAFLLLDALQYFCHVLMHKTPILWRLHAVHHHAEDLEATTALRFHTIEVMIHGLITLSAVLLLGVHVYDVAIYNAILLPVSLFHHSNIRIHPRLEPVLRWITVTPSMHRVHHSRWQPETDSNYAAVLSIWDRIFGTLTPHRQPEAINVGLDGFDARHTQTFKGLLHTPFSDARAELGQPAQPDSIPHHETRPERANGDRESTTGGHRRRHATA